ELVEQGGEEVQVSSSLDLGVDGQDVRTVISDRTQDRRPYAVQRLAKREELVERGKRGGHLGERALHRPDSRPERTPAAGARLVSERCPADDRETGCRALPAWGGRTGRGESEEG